MQELSLLHRAERAANLAGINIRVVSSSVEPRDFGDGEAVFEAGPIVLRIIRDRGQDLVDIAPRLRPGDFHALEDVEVALGWTSLNEVLSRTEPEPLEAALARIAGEMRELDTAFSSDHLDATVEQIRGALTKRREAFWSKGT